MRFLSKSLTAVLLLACFFSGGAQAKEERTAKVVDGIRLDLWENGVTEQNDELGQEEKEILFNADSTEHVRSEELERALGKISFLGAARGQ